MCSSTWIESLDFNSSRISKVSSTLNEFRDLNPATAVAIGSVVQDSLTFTLFQINTDTLRTYKYVEHISLKLLSDLTGFSPNNLLGVKPQTVHCLGTFGVGMGLWNYSNICIPGETLR